MIPNHLHLNSHRNLRLTGIALALLAAILGGTAYLWAQPADTPIVIGDGSLTMESKVPWASFIGSNNQKGHPNGGKSVTSVDVTMPALSHTTSFNSEKAEIDVTYSGNFNISVVTGADGTKLSVKTDFTAFTKQDETHLAHSNATGNITHVTILRNGAVAFDSAASGHTKVTIHYQ